MTVIIDPREVYPNTINSDEFGRVNGITSPIQTQINTKFAPTIAGLAQNDFLMRISATWKNNSFSDTIRRLRDTKKYSMLAWDFTSGVDYNPSSPLTRSYGNGGSTGSGGGINDNTIFGNAVCYSGTDGVAPVGYSFIHTSAILLYLSYFPCVLDIGLYSSVYPQVGADSTIRLGYIDNFTGGAVVDGAYFEGSHSITNWVCKSINSGGTTQTTVTGVAVAGVASKTRFKIVTTGSIAYFYINEAIVATHSTYYPQGLTGIGAGLIRITNGGSQNILQIDRIFFYGNTAYLGDRR